MADVAKVAGVSTTTVSHVLNGTRKVAPETEAVVRDALASTGYRAQPRSPRPGHTVDRHHRPSNVLRDQPVLRRAGARHRVKASRSRLHDDPGRHRRRRKCPERCSEPPAEQTGEWADRQPARRTCPPDRQPPEAYRRALSHRVPRSSITATRGPGVLRVHAVHLNTDCTSRRARPSPDRIRAGRAEYDVGD